MHRANSQTANWKTNFALSLVLAGTILLVVAGAWKWMNRQPKYYSGWPKTHKCSIIGARAVRETVSPRGPYIYRGEYRLEYVVNGRRYSVYASSPYLDEEEAFVLQKLKDLPTACEYSIYYNPSDPTQAHAESR